ncbi:MAG: hypothetical protein H6574_01660 [Lewinellaceae bacterium]|nr:hypothetical protein [Saprospiraceae bacterium]MCB9329765.1 hypothetical protein [Lewinellaceae bacterium]
MKKIFNSGLLPAICLLVSGCTNNNCDKNVAVLAVQPNTNPAGYEVLLKTEGFTNDAAVIFGSVKAETRAGAESGDIIAKVPAGLLGNVEISVEEGDCLARFGNFNVSGGLPSSVQPSLPIIVIPTPPASYPTQGIGNLWANAAGTFDASGNPDQSVLIVEGLTVGDVINFDSDYSVEFNSTDPNLNNNPVSGFANIKTGEIYMEIDRTLKGGVVEHFDGQFIAVPVFLPSNTVFAMLLVSRETGRQLLLFHA